MNGKILITGGSGFIGSRLQSMLKNEGMDFLSPTSNELDMTNISHWGKYSGRGVSAVIHLAGKVSVPESWENPQEFMTKNILGVINALEFCRMENIGLTYISAYVYGVPKKLPIAEKEVSPNNPYAVSKYTGEEIAKYYNSLFDVPVNVLRLFNVYGSGQGDKMLLGHIIDEIYSEKDFITLKDLAPKRDYIHVHDVCRAIILSVSNMNGYHVYNVGSGISHSAGEVANMVQAVAGTKKKIISKNEVRKNEIPDTVADISAIKDAWGWEPTVSFEEGIRECVFNERKNAYK